MRLLRALWSAFVAVWMPTMFDGFGRQKGEVRR